jgi:biopolymer transport protein ExbB
METQVAAQAVNAVASGISIVDLIHQGWYATYPLIAFSVVMVSVLIERLWSLGRIGSADDGLTRKVCADLEEGRVEAADKAIAAAVDRSPAARVYAPLLALLRTSDLHDVLEFCERRRLGESRSFKRNVWVLGTIGSSAPFIGLFGTVVGIIKSFHQMATMGTGGFSVVAAGISEALVATALGLVVAIVAVMFYNYLQVKISNLDTLLRVGMGRVLEAARIGDSRGTR